MGVDKIPRVAWGLILEIGSEKTHGSWSAGVRNNRRQRRQPWPRRRRTGGLHAELRPGSVAKRGPAGKLASRVKCYTKRLWIVDTTLASEDGRLPFRVSNVYFQWAGETSTPTLPHAFETQETMHTYRPPPSPLPPPPPNKIS